MTKRYCAECGAEIEGVPRFCSECGCGLQKTGDAQNVTGNYGNAFNVAGSVSGGIRLVNNVEPNPYKRPPLDFRPSIPSKSMFSINQAITFAALINLISIVSSVFTIFGLNIYNVLEFIHTHHPPPDWHISEWLVTSIIFFTLSMLRLMWLIWLKYAKSFGWFGIEWINANGTIYSFRYKCVCPYCRGTMDPKIMPAKEANNKSEPKWVCRNNEKHQMEYDPTQIHEAAKNGKLNFLFKGIFSL